MTELLDEIRAMITERGPITVEQYMQLALAHPDFGYYMNRDPFGATGDFTTAPEISQMFGELVGLWAAEVWSSMGSPDPVRLVELGPGRGTLMSDALRAARIVPAFRNALDVRLIETSPALATMQHELLVDCGVAVSWAQTLKEIPNGPAIVIGNEFLDALPVRQFVRVNGQWRERTVRVNSEIVRSCLMLAVQTHGSSVQTIEGLSDTGEIADLQAAFRDRNALQCGYCTPGMLMAAQDLLKQEAAPDRERIREHLSGNYCRCTGYQAIIDAVETTAIARNGRSS